MTPQEQLLNIIKELNPYNDFLLFFDGKPIKGKPIKLEEIDFNKKDQIFIIPTENKPLKIIIKEN